jgi:hypothetical protein
MEKPVYLIFVLLPKNSTANPFRPLSKVLLGIPGELSSIHGKVAHIAPGVALIVQFL